MRRSRNEVQRTLEALRAWSCAKTGRGWKLRTAHRQDQAPSDFCVVVTSSPTATNDAAGTAGARSFTSPPTGSGVCERTAGTVRGGGGRKPGQSATPRGPGASRRPYRDRRCSAGSCTQRQSGVPAEAPPPDSYTGSRAPSEESASARGSKIVNNRNLARQSRNRDVIPCGWRSPATTTPMHSTAQQLSASPRRRRCSSCEPEAPMRSAPRRADGCFRVTGVSGRMPGMPRDDAWPRADVR
jgi:hypothetical protein